MSSQPPPIKKIWQVLLADAPAGDGADTASGSRSNSQRIVRTSVFETSSSDINNNMMPLTASALCRKVVEASGEWLVKICHRHPAVIKNNNKKPCIVLVNYGCGYATLVLMNGAELEESSSELNSLATASSWNPIWVTVAVASIKTEEAGKTSHARVQEYGIVSADDAIYDHLAELQSECTEGVRIYLHPTLAAGVFEGSFETDHDTGHGDRKRIFRVWSKSSGDSLAISRIERDLALEQRLRERGGLPSRPTKKAKTSDGMKDAAAKKTHSQKKTAPVPPPTTGATATKAADAAAKGAKKKTAAPKAKSATSSAKSKLDEHSKKESPTSNNNTNLSAASVPPEDKNPQENEPAKKSASMAAGPKPTPSKAQEGAKQASSTSKSNIAEASKDIVPNINNDTETNGNNGHVKKRTRKEVPVESSNNQLGFNPREVVLLYKALNDELDEEDLKKKVINKSTGKAAYSEKETKLARRIFERVDEEVEEMRAAADLEESVDTISDQATETVAKASNSENNNNEKTTGTQEQEKSSDENAGPKESDGHSSSSEEEEEEASEEEEEATPSSSKKPPAKDKETEPTLKRKPGRPKGSKSKPKTTPDQAKATTTKNAAAGSGKDDKAEGSTTVEEKNNKKKATKAVDQETPEKPPVATSETTPAKKTSKSRGKDDKVESTTVEEKNNKKKTTKAVDQETPKKPPVATSETTPGKKKSKGRGKDDKVESTTVEEKNNKKKTTKAVEQETPQKRAVPAATTETNPAAKKKASDSSTPTDEETHSEATNKKRKPGRPKSSKTKTLTTPNGSSKEESKDESKSAAKKKSSKRKRGRSEVSATTAPSSPRTRSSSKDKKTENTGTPTHVLMKEDANTKDKKQ